MNIEELFNMKIFADMKKKEISEEEKKQLEKYANDLIIYIRDENSHNKRDKEDEIREIEELIKILEPIQGDQKVKELIQKENDLIYLLKKELSFFNIASLYFDNVEEIMLFSEKKKRLHKETDNLIELLRKKNII